MSKEPTKGGAPGKSPGTKAKRKLNGYAVPKHLIPLAVADRLPVMPVRGPPVRIALQPFTFCRRKAAHKIVMIVVMLPCFLMAMYEKHGQPLEVVIKNIVQTKFVRPKERPYQTQNLYAVLPSG